MSPLTPYALLVDADPDPRQLAADALARAGWEVHQATDAREALTVFLARSPFELLVVHPTTRDMSAKAMVDVMVRASANLRVLYVSRRDTGASQVPLPFRA